MSIVAISVILAWGISGIFATQSALRNGAHSSVDHPVARVRYLYRCLVLGMAFLLSFMVSPALIHELRPWDLRHLPEWIRGAAVVGVSLPGGVLIYCGLVASSRWTGRRIRNSR